ncbi:MAG: cysteine desulfurase NifS [Candidatus Omnitrophica bacterium]|nr:cysteine desulfurase NifS [Candidatus Omnitrophota bacterium]MBU0878306.1 cysteine desulfurase NifS [Candidatus Omnitrophota bacterium]MBU0896777.1 cysteine desulfurase NifS [Candidatus Omnitrophota bacterium]MBU1134695.1 cysteine desulfurase NifS [Candidatus Omnitrophota bacterium]MBU1809958.1 cysteine desulfurase NifS [Candidatus Omnitrophota bacterium]
MRIVYLDNNATTKVAPEVLEAMKPFFTEEYGNPSSMHTFGGKIHKYIDAARESIADFLAARDPNEIIFTSCGTESDSTAIMSILRSYPDKRHIITTKVEHAAVFNLCKYLETVGYRVTYLNVDNQGMINLSELENSIDEDTAIISVMYANNETGVIFPIKEIAEIAKTKGVIIHTDAVQAAGKVPFKLTELPVDLLSLSGHKLHAPKGVGALYIRRGTRFTPFLIGGHQERGRRGGTENVASIVGLGAACQLAKKYLEDENTRVKNLRDKLENTILQTIPNVRVNPVRCLLSNGVNGDKEERLPNTSNIGFEFIEGEAILLMLDEKGITVSSGSACTSGSLSASGVLKAMGIPSTYIQGSIRFSLSRYNTEGDIDYIIEYLPPIIKRLREISPYRE